MANTLYPQLQSFQLYSSGITVGDTSITLTTMKDIDGVQLSMANFGDKGFITIDAGAGILEEQLSFSGLTANANGTTTLTGVKTVQCLSPYTETSGAAKAHSGGSTVVVSVSSGLLNQFANKGNAETITGVYTFTSTAKVKYNAHPTFTADEEIIDKKYADDLALAGAPDATTTVKGVSELATGAELAAGTATGGTGANLVAAASSFKNSTAGAGDANKVPVLNASGVLDQTFLDSARTWGAVQSFTANNCQITSDADSANDAVRYSLMQSDISKGASSGTSGEAFAIGAPLYIKASDGKLYRCDADADESTFSFVGFALEQATAADQTKLFAKPGSIATGLSGLTAGSYYYISGTVGTISTTPGARFAKVGQAMSTTTLRVIEPKFKVNGSFTVSGTGDTSQTTGFYPAKIVLRAASTSSCSIGEDDNNSVNGSSGNFSYASDGGGYAVHLRNDVSIFCRGTISARSATGFTFNCATYGASTKVYWTAESL